MAGLREIRQLERGDTVLHHIPEAQKTTFARKDCAEVLDRRTLVLESENLFAGTVVRLFVGGT